MPVGIGYLVRLAKDEAPRYAPFSHVSSSWFTEPRSSTAFPFAACAAVSVNVVRIHIWPTKPSGFVPLQSAQAPSAGGAALHDASSNVGIHGAPFLPGAAFHADSQMAPQRCVADA